MPEGPRMRRVAAFLSIAAVTLVCLFASLPRAGAVASVGRGAVTPSPTTVLEPATYTIGQFRTARNEWITGYTVTFPADTDATNVIAGSGDTTSCPDGRTVTVTLADANRVPPRTNNISFVLGNILNPSLDGPYEIVDITLHTELDGVPVDTVLDFGKGGTYDITPVPYLTMSLAGPSGTNLVDFGVVEPGITSTAQDVTVSIDSGVPYDLTRAFVDTELGLSIVGTANGLNLPAGPSMYTDSYTITPPWTTAAETTITVNVTYTVVQY